MTNLNWLSLKRINLIFIWLKQATNWLKKPKKIRVKTTNTLVVLMK
jgi:hypothetical protein